MWNSVPLLLIEFIPQNTILQFINVADKLKTLITCQEISLDGLVGFNRFQNKIKSDNLVNWLEKLSFF